MQVTIEEAARLRNCHTGTIRRAIKAGTLKAEKKMQNNRLMLFVEIEDQGQPEPEPEDSELVRQLRDEITFLRGHVADIMRQLPPAPKPKSQSWWSKMWHGEMWRGK